MCSYVAKNNVVRLLILYPFNLVMMENIKVTTKRNTASLLVSLQTFIRSRKMTLIPSGGMILVLRLTIESYSALKKKSTYVC